MKENIFLCKQTSLYLHLIGHDNEDLFNESFFSWKVEIAEATLIGMYE